MPIDVTEDLRRAIATKEKAISDGRTIAKKGAYKNTKRTEDGSLLWGQCQGGALYQLSIDRSTSEASAPSRAVCGRSARRPASTRSGSSSTG